MELNVSRNSIARIVTFVLIILALIGGGYFAWKSGLLDSLFAQTQTVSTAPAAEPAMKSLVVMYSPNGERSAWETQVCIGMTDQGCKLFHAMFANPIWNSALNGKSASATFVKVAKTLDDGSQVWKTEIVDSQATLPVYIHVTKNKSGQWLLNRVLFAQEAAKYENP